MKNCERNEAFQELLINIIGIKRQKALKNCEKDVKSQYKICFEYEKI